MRKNIIRIAVLLTLLVTGVMSFAQGNYPVSTYQVENFMVFEKDQVKIPCEWDFFWGKFVPQNDFSVKPDLQTEIPSRWNSYTELPSYIRAIAKTGKGSGTYRVKLVGLKPNTSYSFFCYDLVGTAFSAFCNGKKIYQAGEPNEDWEQTVPQSYMDIATFSSNSKGEALLTFYISNKVYRKAGFWGTFRIQETAGCYDWYNRKICSNSLVLGLLLTVVAYSLLVGILRKDWSYILLASYVFSIFIRCFSSDFPILKHFFPEISYSTIKRLEFSALCMAPALYTLYVWSMDKETLGNKVWFLVAPGAVLAFINFFMPFEISNRFVPVMQAYMFVVIIVDIVAILVRIVLNRNLVSIFSISTLFIVGIGCINDIASANVNFIFAGVKILTYTFVLYAFCQTAFLAYLQNKNQIKASKLNGYFNESNDVYLKYVPKQMPKLLGKEKLADLKAGDVISKKMAIICVDLRNFTASTQGISENKMLDVLNFFAETVNPVIRNYNGIPTQKYGDEIMGIFPNDPEDALNCALAIQEKLVLFRAECKDMQLPVLKAGVGVHYGPITIGLTAISDSQISVDMISSELDVVKETEQLTKTFKKSIVVTKEAIKAATVSAKEKGKKFDFNGIRLATSTENVYYNIYNSKVGSDL